MSRFLSSCGLSLGLKNSLSSFIILLLHSDSPSSPSLGISLVIFHSSLLSEFLPFLFFLFVRPFTPESLLFGLLD
jgi:hypothetical protein